MGDVMASPNVCDQDGTGPEGVTRGGKLTDVYREVGARTAVGAGAVVALAAAFVEYAHDHRPAYALGAFAAGAIAVAIAWFVTTLPGLSVRGLVIGGFFVLAGMISWTSLNYGRWLVWPLLAAEGIVFAVWSWPWLRDLRQLPRLGTAWLGLAYWLLGVAGAIVALRLGIAVQRVVYAGVFGLAVLAVVASARRDPGADGAGSDRGRDLSAGIAGAFLLAIALLALSGSGNLFQHNHVIPNSLWGAGMTHRFWGGPWLLYHPNSLALIAVAAALRIGADRAFAVWQRLTVAVLAGAVIEITDSRTAFGFFAVAGVVHAYLLWRRPGAGLPAYRKPWLAAATPFVVIALILVVSHGEGFLFKSRYGDSDPTSGRADTWKKVGQDWVHGSVDHKLLGDNRTVRAVVHRADDGTRPGQKPLDLTTDNAAVGALQRAGVLGVLAFLFGLGRLLWVAWRGTARRAPPAWLTIAAIGSVPTIATADWLLGGTGGTLWILLTAGEAWLVLGPSHRSRTDPPSAGARTAPAQRDQTTSRGSTPL
jgi:hypothetical protein